MSKLLIKQHYPNKLKDLIKINEAQPEQRSQSWYELRQNMITASDIATLLPVTKYELDLHKKGIIKLPGAAKIGAKSNKFGTLKEFIQKKCGCGKAWEGNQWTKWGVKYEPVITEIYEKSEGCEVLEFGLMPHPTIKWLGASPDGITDTLKMIEIKAPMTREITKEIPLQYWMQMQIQLECCDLEECDFVEVRIEEYKKETDYFDDVFIDEEGNEEFYLEHKEGLPKGTVICIQKLTDDGNFLTEYVYPPVLEFNNAQEEKDWVVQWIKDRVSLHPENAYNWIFYKNCDFSLTRFKVIEYSNVKIMRDKEWFKLRKPDLEEWWNKILEYRENGLPPKFQPTPETLRKKRSTLKEGDCLIIESDDDEDDIVIKKISSKIKLEPKNKIPVLDLGGDILNDPDETIPIPDVEVDDFIESSEDY